MSEPRTPQVPMVDGNGEPFYPLTQYNQIVMPDGSRWDGKGGGAQIDDTSASAEKVYSSSKTQYELDQLSEHKANKAGWTADKFLGTDANGNMTVKDAPKSESNPLDKFEIGVIYHFAIDVNPPEKYGGEWEQIKGRILIGTGSPENNDDGTSPGDYNYALGNKNGEATVTLAGSQLPISKISIAIQNSNETQSASRAALSSSWTNKWSESTASSGRADSGSFGGGEAHNNMPPYLAVNMWKRVA